MIIRKDTARLCGRILYWRWGECSGNLKQAHACQRVSASSCTHGPTRWRWHEGCRLVPSRATTLATVSAPSHAHITRIQKRKLRNEMTCVTGAKHIPRGTCLTAPSLSQRNGGCVHLGPLVRCGLRNPQPSTLYGSYRTNQAPLDYFKCFSALTATSQTPITHTATTRHERDDYKLDCHLDHSIISSSCSAPSCLALALAFMCHLTLSSPSITVGRAVHDGMPFHAHLQSFLVPRALAKVLVGHRRRHLHPRRRSELLLRPPTRVCHRFKNSHSGNVQR